MSDIKYTQILPYPIFLLLIILISTLAPFATDMYLSSTPLMLEEFNTTEFILSMSLYGFFIAMAASMIVFGPVSEKYGRKGVLIISMSVFTAASMACAVIPDDIRLFIFFRIIEALGAGAALVVSMALIKDCFSGSIMKKIFAVVTIFSVLGPILSPVLGTAFAVIFGWRSTFWFTAGLGMICLLIADRMSETLRNEHRYTGSITGSLLRLCKVAKNHNFMIYLIIMTAPVFAFLGHLAVSPYIYQEYFGLTRVDFCIYLAATVIAGLIFLKPLLWINEKIGNRRTTTLLFFISCAGFLIMVIFGHDSPALFFASMIPISAVTTAVRPISQTILMSQKEGDAGAESAYLTSAPFIAGAFGMIFCTLPWNDFILSLSLAALLFIAVYGILWAYMLKHGTGLKGLGVGE